MTFRSHHEIFIRRSWYSVLHWCNEYHEDLVMRSKRQNKILKFWLWYNFLLRIVIRTKWIYFSINNTEWYWRFEELEAMNTDQKIAIRVDFEQVTKLGVKPQTSNSHNKHTSLNQLPENLSHSHSFHQNFISRREHLILTVRVSPFCHS